MLEPEKVRHIAKLARLHLSDAEVERYGAQLTRILDYVEILGEVNTDGVEEKNQVTGLANIMQEDKVAEKSVEPSELLAQSELVRESDQIKVMSTIK